MERIFIKSEDGQDSPSKASYNLFSNLDGVFRTETNDQCALAFENLADVGTVTVYPDGEQWNTLIVDPQLNAEYRCAIITPEHRTWWKNAVGLDEERSLEKVSVGVIDVGFGDAEQNPNVSYYKHYPDAEPSPSGHGKRVCSLISNSATNFKNGVCSEVPLFFYECASTVENFEDSPEYSSVALSSGVRYLSNLGVNLINISGGLFLENEVPSLATAISEAADMGSLCICASGNEQLEAVAQPARYTESVAVGGVGRKGTFPLGSHASFIEAISLSDKQHLKELEWYPSSHTSTNEFGVNVVGPSIGIILTFLEKSATDYIGTSYASPIVVGLLATRLENDIDYHRETGRKKTEYARRVLREMSVDLGVEHNKQGWGLPVLER